MYQLMWPMLPCHDFQIHKISKPLVACVHTLLLFPSALVLANSLILSAITNFFCERTFILVISEICGIVKSSNSPGYAMTDIFLMATHAADVKKKSVISFPTPPALCYFFFFIFLVCTWVVYNEPIFPQSPSHSTALVVLSETLYCSCGFMFQSYNYSSLCRVSNRSTLCKIG